MKIYHNENDPQCCDVLRRHFPDSTVDERSIKDVKGEDLAGYDQCHFFAGIGGFSLAFQRVGTPAGITVWTGGFPCQDLSVAGNRAGLAGERSGLYFEFHRLLTERYPDVVVIENVPGLLSSNEGKDFAIVIGGLTGHVPEVPAEGWGSAGAFRGGIYTVVYRILDAQFFGLAQRRRRVFIVGHLGDGRAAKVLFESEGLSGNTPQGREAGKDIAYSIRANPSHSGDKGDGGINTTMVVEQNNVVSTPDMVSLRSNPAQPVIFAQNSRDEVRLLGGDGRLAGSLSAQPGMKQQSYVAWDMYNFTDTGDKAGTLCGEGLKRQNRGFGIGVRRLTPTECERLQGFPDGWTDGQCDSARYRQLGNAVAVTVIEWIAKRLKMVEKCRQ